MKKAGESSKSKPAKKVNVRPCVDISPDYIPAPVGIGVFARITHRRMFRCRSESSHTEKPSTSKKTKASKNCPHQEHRCLLARSMSDTQIETRQDRPRMMREEPVEYTEEPRHSIGCAMGKGKKKLVHTRSLESMRNVTEYGEIAEEVLRSNAIKPKDHLYKILVIGDLGTGKTSIIKRYVHRFFTQHYRATIGVDFALKVINWDDHTTIRLQLWDIAGQERYGNMTRVYYKEAVGAFIVFDATRKSTFETVINWKQDLDSKVQLPDGSPIPCVLLANKCDQPKEGLVTNPTRMKEYCKENGFSGWMETSARDNINIDEAAKALVQKILDVDNLINKNKDGDQFTLTSEAESKQPKKKCVC